MPNTQYIPKAGWKRCPKCESLRPISDFAKDSARPDGRGCWCRVCRKAYHAVWYARNQEAKRKQNKEWADKNRPLARRLSRRAYIHKRYGLSAEQYAGRLESQQGLCAVCHQPETRIVKGTLACLCVDHSHQSGKIRGLLCSRCNYTIGLLKDDVALFRSAAAYLEANQ